MASNPQVGPSLVLARGNEFVAALPRAVAARLEPYLESVPLQKKEVLFRAHEPLRAVYFPTSAVISLVSRLESGEMLEVGLIGRDGLAGAALFPGMTSMSWDGVVQIAGLAQRISADVLRQEMLASAPLSWAIARYAQVLLIRSMQMSLCNMFHPVEQRCMRWLLTIADLVDGDVLPLTHDLIATMLGIRRPTVTLVLGSLRRAGLITDERGRIVLRDRTKLEAVCCECYVTMRDEQRRLMDWAPSDRAVSM
jgi:CRP-like cAMP-binding protein